MIVLLLLYPCARNVWATYKEWREVLAPLAIFDPR